MWWGGKRRNLPRNSEKVLAGILENRKENRDLRKSIATNADTLFTRLTYFLSENSKHL